MDIKELRIGDWIYQKNIAPNGQYGEMVEVLEPVVVDIDILAEILRGNKLERYKPIELTEELLIKIGFVYVDNQEHYVLNRVIFNKGMTMMFYSSSKGEVQYARLKAPKYLHNLQNAWIILTGQELPISLNI